MAASGGNGAPIALYGATGFTGRLVASELSRAKVEFVLAGRNVAKLEALASELGAGRVAAVSLDDAAGLRDLLEPCAAVITCAGPFSLHGEPVVAAAAEVGTHYLDTTGEQPFMRRVFEIHGPAAERSGAALVTAMGFDYVPGDMIAALTAEGMGALERIELSYAVLGFGPSRGTAHSALAMIGDADVEWRDGALMPADRSIGRGRFRFEGEIGEQRMVRYPAGEHITVPRHVETRSVRTRLTAATTMPPGLGAAAPALMPGLQLALRAGVLRRGLDAAVRRLPEGPKPQRRERARFEIACVARAGEHERRGTIRGRDIYGLTARSIVAGAVRMADPGFQGTGALAPSQAFPPREFLSELAGFDVTYDVEPAAPADPAASQSTAT